MTKCPLFSSGEIVSALLRAGFTLARKSAGSHSAYKKPRPTGGHYVVIVPLGAKVVPRGTFESILRQAGLTEQEFLGFAKVRRKGSS